MNKRGFYTLNTRLHKLHIPHCANDVLCTLHIPIPQTLHTLHSALCALGTPQHTHSAHSFYGVHTYHKPLESICDPGENPVYTAMQCWDCSAAAT